ncbi:MAG: tRNA (adenosine(37)-N6)-threonylcarbamoyltransferase complex ATPase subunit type 1 TsaE [Dehalococcoidia bacterium]|nr:tRNA (adenosine(37)-N6)-threonylcarbamoyltransferase complex ATPase subunit type 1 TsaE [Dehalococcoidia bacterium]
MNCISPSPEQTQRLGRALGESANVGDVILLVGDLGAGKTTLTQGIAWGLGVAEYAVSPSFVLVRQYQGRLPLYHVDLYRLENVAEIGDLGLDEYFYGKGVSVVEWADRGLVLLPPEHLLVKIELVGETERVLHLQPKGKRYEKLVEALADLCEIQKD